MSTFFACLTSILSTGFSTMIDASHCKVHLRLLARATGRPGELSLPRIPVFEVDVGEVFTAGLFDILSLYVLVEVGAVRHGVAVHAQAIRLCTVFPSPADRLS